MNKEIEVRKLGYYICSGFLFLGFLFLGFLFLGFFWFLWFFCFYGFCFCIRNKALVLYLFTFIRHLYTPSNILLVCEEHCPACYHQILNQ